MKEKKDKKIINRIAETHPYGFKVVENVFEIVKSYDKTIDVLENACALNRDPVNLACEGFSGGVMKDNPEEPEWKALDISNLPDLTKNYDFECNIESGKWIQDYNTKSHIISACIDGSVYRYRSRQPEKKEVSHADIYSKFWYVYDEYECYWFWMKVDTYRDCKYFICLNEDGEEKWVDKKYFENRKSAEIPPEN